MDFRDLATALSDIIKEVKKATRVLGQGQLLWLEVLVETHFVMVISQLYTFSNKLVVSSSYGEIRGWV